MCAGFGYGVDFPFWMQLSSTQPSDSKQTVELVNFYLGGWIWNIWIPKPTENYMVAAMMLMMMMLMLVLLMMKI